MSDAPAKVARPRALKAVSPRLVSVSQFMAARESLTLMIILAFGLAMSIVSPRFLTVGNLRSVALALSMEVPVAVGMQVLLIAGLFDLSVGSVSALASITVGLLLASGFPIPLAILCGLLVGAAVGFVNGTLVTRFRFNPLIVTLGTMTVARGLALGITQGRVSAGFPASFGFLGQSSLGSVPVPVIIAMVFIVLGDVSLRKLRVCRQLYYVGGNEKAAVYAGIDVNRVKLTAFFLTGLTAALAGIVVTSRVMASAPTLNEDLALRVIAACIIGGASLSGGEGSIAGALLGLVLMFLINNAMVLLGISVYWQGVVIGTILILALAVDAATKNIRRR